MGITIAGPLIHQPTEEARAHSETNAIGLVSVTQAFLPLLGVRTPQTHPLGKIVDTGSTEGKVSSRFLSAFSRRLPDEAVRPPPKRPSALAS